MATTSSNLGAIPVEHAKGNGSLLIVALIVMALGNVAFWYLRVRPSSNAPIPAKEMPAETVPLDAMTVNLAGSDGFLRVSLSLALEPTATATADDRSEAARSAATRDAVLSVLASSSADELLTAEGKNVLKNSLRTAIAAREQQLHVKDVFFTEFLIQR
jgi:flagellar FliL protein